MALDLGLDGRLAMIMRNFCWAVGFTLLGGLTEAKPDPKPDPKPNKGAAESSAPKAAKGDPPKNRPDPELLRQLELLESMELLEDLDLLMDESR